ncbi:MULTISPECIES: Type 1 glutamine amidotransferase-like domain-containing protein [Paenibacillus]|uniref:Type 1 glutamine amidotransferase-like domain-containing protein n=1 Tax=Paenibacillus TaxID=44249 RepID=UPI0022B8C95C|nr:Type 1 glutamine amidotransferase-like domain-containing protein [Paenibacillus caseinilyticus]MCZ8518491.1 Type 1 glutamine amidotransferase-like domain-containing protein [Paenibacillus caseinilyticus]
MKIMLTSNGISNNRIREELIQLLELPITSRRACIITTASNHKEKSYGATLANQLFQNLGFVRTDFLDVQYESPNILWEYDVIYINGGNPFFLLLWLYKSNAIETLRNVALRDKIIIGTSAGAMVLADSIKHVNQLNVIAGYDPMDVDELSDHSAVGLVKINVVPHYNRFMDANPQFETKLQQLEQQTNIGFERLADGEAIVIDGDTVKKLANCSTNEER